MSSAYQPLAAPSVREGDIVRARQRAGDIVRLRENAPGYKPDTRYVEEYEGCYRFVRRTTPRDRARGEVILAPIFYDRPESFEPADLPEDY